MSRVLIFDLDDTLIDSEAAYRHALTQVGVDPVDYQKARGEVKTNLPAGHVAARNRLLYFKAYLEDQNRYSARGVLEMMEVYERQMAQAMERQWRDLGRTGLLKRLATARRALLTNENLRTQLVKLRALGPEVDFEYVLTSEEAGFEKPQKEIYIRLIRRLGVPENRCIFVGDDVVKDIVPAVNLGMRAVWTREFLSPESVERQTQRLNDDLGSRAKEVSLVESLDELVALGL